MDIAALLGNDSLKSLEKRGRLIQALTDRTVAVQDIIALDLKDRETGIVLEAMEAVSGTDPGLAGPEWLAWAEPFISSPSNSLKREASRIAGNLAACFPDKLEGAVKRLLENTGNDKTVVRWGSAYALGRIVQIPRYAGGELFTTVQELARSEENQGVKKQYLAGLKKAEKLRK
ncbi:hypothetical protein [Breznakiella homolactica]|uniref:HEAT repeat domain-containing protein n=1 Tax=Breznakiella homolactica TaxID=2798577 RepID=A0A7T7XK14_9SPIR|nr:hypothetical protein [Breznakiella homolactica]QQO07839.1 hypothetical protein JFL75_12915 [Breznakiella homolactica]